MNIRVEVRPEADNQIDAIDHWWIEHRRSSPDLFLTEFDDAKKELQLAPEIGKSYRRRGIPGLRRLLMLRTQCHIHYTYDESAGVVSILSVWSALRRRGPPVRSLPAR